MHACLSLQEYVSGLDHRFKQLRARARTHTHRWSVDLRCRAVLVRSMNASRSHELSFPPFSSLRITGGTSLCAGEEPEKVTLGRERATTNLDLSVNEYREACAACTQTIFFLDHTILMRFSQTRTHTCSYATAELDRKIRRNPTQNPPFGYILTLQTTSSFYGLQPVPFTCLGH